MKVLSINTFTTKLPNKHFNDPIERSLRILLGSLIVKLLIEIRRKTGLQSCEKVKRNALLVFRRNEAERSETYDLHLMLYTYRAVVRGGLRGALISLTPWNLGLHK